MSGICAVVNFDGEPVDPDVLRAMAEQCSYRGPDGIRYWVKGNVGLAHLALHATPESLREVQPQLGEDGNLCLTADIRVDNRPELIGLLQAKGQPVNRNSTDADLVLAAYRVWGVECPLQIIGDYAFAIWDARAQRLFCARDVYGVKSLHYSRVGSTLCVASEAQQIIQHPKIPRILDEVTVADFLVKNFNGAGRTMFEGVWAVKRAHYLVADSSGQRMEHYWDIDPDHRITYKSDAEYAAHFLEIFQRAVADRLRTPDGTTIGITMSGGMDSTSVAAVAQKIINHQAGQPHLLACTYAFDQLQECDETYYSRAMADELGIDLNYVPAEEFWYLDDDEAFRPSLETPRMWEESLTRHILQIFKTSRASVWLTGHGGDDLLSGSSLVCTDRLKHGDLGILSEVTRYWKGLNLPVSRLWWAYRNWFIDPLLHEFIRPLVPAFIRENWRKLRASHGYDLLAADFISRTHIVERLSDSQFPRRYSDATRQAIYESGVCIDQLQPSLEGVERLASYFSMEVRHPFLDRRLVEFLLSVPPDLLFRAGQQKFILRQAMAGILPEVVRNRQNKTIFSNYVGYGLRYRALGKIKVMFQAPLQIELNIVKLSKLQSLYDRYVTIGSPLDNNYIWNLISLELWLRNYSPFINGEYHGSTR